jgi:hypothetical protein
MTDSEMRALVLEAIRDANVRDFENLRLTLLKRIGSLRDKDHLQARRILWDLVVERLISWGAERTPNGPSFT